MRAENPLEKSWFIYCLMELSSTCYYLSCIDLNYKFQQSRFTQLVLHEKWNKCLKYQGLYIRMKA